LKKPEKQYNPFDNFPFWLWLASFDFSFWFEEIVKKEPDTRHYKSIIEKKYNDMKK
jgi:hypothetical protein